VVPSVNACRNHAQRSWQELSMVQTMSWHGPYLHKRLQSVTVHLGSQNPTSTVFLLRVSNIQ
jgi:hypothetical protein